MDCSFRAAANHMAITLAAPKQAATRRKFTVTAFNGLCALTTTKTAPKIAPTSNPVIRCMTSLKSAPDSVCMGARARTRSAWHYLAAPRK